MNIQQYGKLTFASVLVGALSTQVHANSCGEVSPLLERMGEDYYTLQHAPESAGALDAKTLTSLLARTKLKSGDGLRYKCFGEDAAHRTVPTKFTLEDIERVETLNGRSQLNAWENSNRKIASAAIDLPEASLWQATSKNVYTSSMLFRRRNLEAFKPGSEAAREHHRFWPFKAPNHDYYEGGSYIGELTTQIERRPNGLVLTQIMYVNGYKAEWVTWNLDG